MNDNNYIITDSSHYEILNRDIQQKGKDFFINKVHSVNFQDNTITSVFRHNAFNRTINLTLKPYPCFDDRLQCLWADDLIHDINLDQYTFQKLIITDDKEVVYAEPNLLEFNDEYIIFHLPETCYQHNIQSFNAFSCRNIKVTLYQNSAVFIGELVEYSTAFLKAIIELNEYQTIEWINLDYPVIVLLQENGYTYYSGECKILGFEEEKKKSICICTFELTQRVSPRFKAKKNRSLRQKITPSPDIIFIHPITKKKVILKVNDISGSGLSVIEKLFNAQLVPGIILPNVEIHFAGGLKIHCSVQVVYSYPYSDKNAVSFRKSGLAFLDMNMEDNIKILSILQQAIDEHSYICNEVDMDELWDFFFRSGFIYPDKYEQIQDNKEQLKKTYSKIYKNNPHIARHFIYQDNGNILGHMAMIRFYHNSWLIHHHAASSKAHWAGIKVLGQLIRYANNVHNLASAHMRYVFSYFRPEKKFPRKVLGGLVESINDSQKCSMDTFAYFVFDLNKHNKHTFVSQSTLSKPNRMDLLDIEYFYGQASNGLLIDAFNLHNINDPSCKLEQQYHQLGFKREKTVFCLKYKDNLKAVFIVNISDLGLNLSDLANCVQVIVTDGKNFGQETLFSALAKICPYFDYNSFPVLIYPQSYANSLSIPIKKHYNLWILDLFYIDEYVKFYDRLLGRYF